MNRAKITPEMIADDAPIADYIHRRVAQIRGHAAAPSESPERKLLRELADICHRTGMAQIRKARAILEYLSTHPDEEKPNEH